MGMIIFCLSTTLLLVGFVAQAFEHSQRAADSRRAVAKVAVWRADLHPSPQTVPGFLHLRVDCDSPRSIQSWLRLDPNQSSLVER